MNALTRGDRDANLDTIRDELRAQAERAAQALKGERNRKLSSRHEWRWGKKGSFCLALSGAKRGLCFDHDANEGGDLLWWIGREIGGGFPETVAWARDLLDMPEPTSRPDTEAERARRETRRKALAEKRDKERAEREAAQAADEARRTAYAKNFAAEAVPADGTPADIYLTKWRRILRPAGGWPDAVRYHRGQHALLVVATDDAGEVRAVQLVHLAADAKKLPKEEAQARGYPNTKLTYGVMEGAAVRLPATANTDRAPLDLLVAEGPETGLSVWAATGAQTWIALGTTSKVTPPPGSVAVICADDDERQRKGRDKLRDTRGAWRKAGVQVHVAWPWAVRRFDKSDFNDVLREEGAVAVQARVAAALPQEDGPDTRLDVEVGREELRKAVAAFFTAARGFDADDPDGPPPVVHAIRADVGLGKSAETREAILRMVLDLRARGNRRKVAILIPTHKLGDEQAAALERMPEFAFAGLKVRVWRGRKAPDPEHEDYSNDAIPKPQKTAMCLDLDAVADVERLGLPVEEHACRSKKGTCPFHDICGHQRQKQEDADVWIGPHEMLFNQKPQALGDLAAVVVDEAAWQDGLEGVGGPPNDLALAAIDPDMAVPNDGSGAKTARLRELVQRLLAGLDAHGDGELRAGPLLEAGLDEETAREGIDLAYKCVIDPGIVPGMPAETRRELARTATGNRTAKRLASVFSKIKALLTDHPLNASGWLELRHKDTEDGRIRVLRIRGRRPVRKGWRVPTLIIDALLDERLVKPFWPRVQVTARISVTTPHTRFLQVMDKGFAQSALVPDERQSEEENERRLRQSRRARAVVFREARRTNGRVLVVAQKEVREYWESLGALPGNVELAHFNAIAGMDIWGPQRDADGNLTDPGVALVVLVGRILPPAAAVENMARALTGLGLGSLAGGYLRATARHRLADGRTIAAETDWHPHPIAEAIRQQCCEGELIQGAGRGRPANRMAANPLDVLVMTDRVLPFPVDEAVSWDEMAPDWCDDMMATGGVALENAADAAKAYGGSRFAVWRASDRREDRFDHARWLRSSYRENPLGEPQPPRNRVTFSYQLRGSGQKPQLGVVDLALVPDPKAWLAERLGPVRWCHVDEPEPEPEPPAASENRSTAEAPAEEPPPPAPEPTTATLMEALAAEGLAPLAAAGPPPALMRLVRARAGGRPVVADVAVFDTPTPREEEAAHKEEERMRRISGYDWFVTDFLALGPATTSRR